MKKLFDKHETVISIAIIVLYVIINSYCMQNFGLQDYRSTLINTIFSIVILALVISTKRTSYYGLTKVTNLKKYLFFIPLLLISSINVWNGININHGTGEILFYILSMANIGFLEEIIFRGFLFKMMEKDNLKIAILVSSLTFGLGHVVNLLNGADLVPTLVQICYAIALGYLFVIIFHKSKSIVPCILSHMLIDITSVFNIENTLSIYIIPAFLVVASLTYAIYILKTVKE